MRVVHERAVELEDVGRDRDQLLEPGVARARVVEGDARAPGAQLGDAVRERLRRAEQVVLGELDHERGQVLREGLHHERRGERARADVDGEEGALGAAADGQRRAQRRGLELGAEAGAMRLGEPLVGRALGLGVHARERLVAGDTARGELEHGLEGGLDRTLAQQRLDLLALLAGRGTAREVDAIAERAPAAGVLGGVERGVGAREQVGRVGRVLGMGRDAGGGGERAPADLHLGDRRAGALGRLAGAGGPDAGQHEHELLAAEAPDGVAVAHHGAEPAGGERERAVPLGVAQRVVDALEAVEVEHDHADGLAGGGGGGERRAQALLAAAVVEQPGQGVGADLLAQPLALARGVVGERGHRGEALHELDLGVAERDLRAGPVDVERADHAVVGDQRHGDERLRDLVGPGDHRAQRLEQRVRDVARTAVADRPARHAAGEVDVLGQDLLDPLADREHGLEVAAALEDLVQRQVVERDQRREVVRDPRQRALQRVRGEDAGGGIDERLEGGFAASRGTRGRSRSNGHQR